MASLYTAGFEIFFHDAVFRIYSIGERKTTISDKNRKCAADVPGSDGNHVLNIIHAHSYYEIHLIFEGKTDFWTDERVITVSEGELLILPPDCSHLSHIDKAPYSEAVISFGLGVCSGHGRDFYRYFREHLNALAKQPISLPEYAVTKIMNIVGAIKDSPAFFNMNEEAVKKNLSIGKYCEQETELTNLLMLLFRSVGLFRDDAGYCRSTEGERNILLENLVNNVSLPLERIAKMLGYSVRYTSKIIHSYYGESLTAVRGRMRFSSLQRILEEYPEDSLEAAGKKAGYYNSSALIRAVRTYAGCTPTELRRQIEKNKINEHK